MFVVTASAGELLRPLSQNIRQLMQWIKRSHKACRMFSGLGEQQTPARQRPRRYSPPVIVSSPTTTINTIKNETSDPERATMNLFQRDVLLAERVKAQAQSRGLTVCEVDGSRSAKEIATLIERHFEPFLLTKSDTEKERDSKTCPERNRRREL